MQRFNATSKSLQKIEIDLATCVHLYEILLEFVRSVRNDKAFENFEEMAKLLVEDYSYRRGAVVKGVEHISTICVSQRLSGAGSSPAGSVGRDLNLQKLNYQYLTTSVAVVLVVR